MKNSVKPQNETRNDGDTSLGLETRRFTYNEIERITNNLQQVLGKGGFGYVYDGFLNDGTQVAVKIRSESSNQGDKEFLAEVQFIISLHLHSSLSFNSLIFRSPYIALNVKYKISRYI